MGKLVGIILGCLAFIVVAFIEALCYVAGKADDWQRRLWEKRKGIL